MKQTTIPAIVLLLVVMVSGCTMKTVDGAEIQFSGIAQANSVDVENRFYQGVYTGCIQTLVMQSRAQPLLMPDLPEQIAKQCMAIAAIAVQSNTHTIAIPGWPGLESIREVLKQIEDEKSLPGMASF